MLWRLVPPCQESALTTAWVITNERCRPSVPDRVYVVGMTKADLHDEGSDGTARLRTPRWYAPSVGALGLVGLVLLLYPDGQPDWPMVLFFLAVAALTVVVLAARRWFDAGEGAERVGATYGSFVFFGLAWVGLGIFEIVGRFQRYVPGSFALAFGLLTVAAYLPAFIRERAHRARTRETTGEPPSQPE